MGLRCYRTAANSVVVFGSAAYNYRNSLYNRNMSQCPEAAAEILAACLKSPDHDAWLAFVHCFQPVMAAAVARVAHACNSFRPALVDDLVQDTYAKLFDENCRRLREFHPEREESPCAYIGTIARNVAFDHFRRRFTQKRGAEVESTGKEENTAAPAQTVHEAVLVRELERKLAESVSPRDLLIFRLYYLESFTAKEIASLPHLGLTQKGVESTIYRLTKILRGMMASYTRPDGGDALSAEGKEPPHKGIGPRKTLGDKE